jgi:hypothetical protein
MRLNQDPKPAILSYISRSFQQPLELGLDSFPQIFSNLLFTDESTSECYRFWSTNSDCNQIVNINV